MDSQNLPSQIEALVPAKSNDARRFAQHITLLCDAVRPTDEDTREVSAMRRRLYHVAIDALNYSLPAIEWDGAHHYAFSAAPRSPKENARELRIFERYGADFELHLLKDGKVGEALDFFHALLQEPEGAEQLRKAIADSSEPAQLHQLQQTILETLGQHYKVLAKRAPDWESSIESIQGRRLGA
jgi:hypothetical protein